VYVYARQLAEALSVSTELLRRWGVAGLLYGSGGVYESSEVDRFLMAYARNFGDVPASWASLQKIAPVISQSTVQSLHDLSKSQFKALLRNFPVSYFDFPTGESRRYVRQSIVHHLSSMPDTVRLADAIRATGFSDGESFKSVTGLQPISNIRRSDSCSYVSKAGLLAYLRNRVCGASAEDWLEDCLATNDPPIQARKVAAMLGISPKVPQAVFVELGRRDAPFVLRKASPKGDTAFVSPLWVSAQFEQDTPCTASEVARLFGVGPTIPYRWREKGQIRCDAPGHTHTEYDSFLYRPCWLVYLRANCSSNVKGYMYRFMLHRLTVPDPEPLLTATEVAQLAGVSDVAVRQWLQKGTLYGIVTPSGIPRFTRGWVEQAIAARRRALS